METVNKEKILLESLSKIDEMIFNARKNKTIDIKDLRLERRNCVKALKQLK